MAEESAETLPFLMAVEDVFSIPGRGAVATGRIERGEVKVGDVVEIVGMRPTQKATVVGLEISRKMLGAAKADDNVGILLRGIEKDRVERGQVISAPGSITVHSKFTATISMMTAAQGGRPTPLTNGHRLRFHFRTLSLAGSIELPVGVTELMPGGSADCLVTLDIPVAMEKDQATAITEDRQGGRHGVGSGTVIEAFE